MPRLKAISERIIQLAVVLLMLAMITRLSWGIVDVSDGETRELLEVPAHPFFQASFVLGILAAIMGAAGLGLRYLSERKVRVRESR